MTSPSLSTLHVSDIELPREFERLYELAYNLWWTWTPEARNLFASIDGAKWSRYRNPVQLLINIEPRHWYELLEDEDFVARYHSILAAFDAYMAEPDTWYSQQSADSSDLIGYFSMEYGLHQCLAIYSGGLGVLSGDHCKSASDLGLPFVGIGLLYRHGYFMQTIDAEGVQQHIYPEYDFSRLPLRPVATATGQEVKIRVPLPGRDVTVQLWLAQVGRVPLILLNTDLPENHVADRPITHQLYVRGREMRLVQEIVLGVGGVKALEALGIEPTAWHLNEGHSVFLQLERLRRQAAGNPVDAQAKLHDLRHSSVFTTHTPVPAGNEQFDPQLIRKYFTAWCDEVQLPMDDLLRLGRAHDGDSAFNLTALAIRTASRINGVSQLNAQVASQMWRHLFPPEAGEQPIRAITNGVHARTWLGPEVQRLLHDQFDEQWPAKLLEPDSWQQIFKINDGDIWRAHGKQKNRLGRFVRSSLREQHARHGGSPDELRAVDAIFDDRALTIGFARRFATYKRASLIFSDIHRLQQLLSDPDRPVQLLFAGKAHPADRPGQGLIQRIFELSRTDAFRGKVVMLENYDIRMGRMLVQGVDVWLNTPRKPMEASGTSGQKSAMNGALNLSIADGWWPEGFNGSNGWVIGNGEDAADDAAQDQADVDSFYHLLGDEILPKFFDRSKEDLPHDWIAMMKDSMATLTPKFSASRMVADYVTDAYLPVMAQSRKVRD